MKLFAGKTVLVTGGSRGIGLAIALRLARDGANIAIAAKTSKPNAKLPGTIYTAAAEVDAAGGNALPIQMDLRNEDEIAAAVAQTVERFGGLDILINNAGAMWREPTLETTAKRFDLLNAVNVRGPFLITQKSIPYLRRASNPHVLMIAPIPELPHISQTEFPAYLISKYSMSLFTLAFANEFRADGIAFNALWPRTAIWTAAGAAIRGEEGRRYARKASVMGDAAWHILAQDSRSFTGRFTLDDDVLRDAGVTDFSPYMEEGSDAAKLRLSLPVTHGLRRE
ncbi:MAG TPA: SDR family oxidoreductase [Steroidobacteraceae bacterium]|jgi:citronellol/citronellal dehydrogenase